MSLCRQVPLNVLTTGADGKPVVDKALLKTRETTYKLDVSKLWKINAGTTGVCTSLLFVSLLPRLSAAQTASCTPPSDSPSSAKRLRALGLRSPSKTGSASFRTR